jgi:hypothetical protein
MPSRSPGRSVGHLPAGRLASLCRAPDPTQIAPVQPPAGAPAQRRPGQSRPLRLCLAGVRDRDRTLLPAGIDTSGADSTSRIRTRLSPSVCPASSCPPPSPVSSRAHSAGTPPPTRVFRARRRLMNAAGLRRSASSSRVHPPIPGLDPHPRNCAGPITRSAEDAALVLDVIAGHDRRDHTTTGVSGEDYIAPSTTGSTGFGWACPRATSRTTRTASWGTQCVARSHTPEHWAYVSRRSWSLVSTRLWARAPRSIWPRSPQTTAGSTRHSDE